MSRAFVAVLVLAIAVPAALPARAELGAWNHRSNIKDAANRLAKLHRKEGSKGVLKFLDACYRTHLLAEKFSKGLEACMAQDYMHTQVLASVYSRLSPEALKKTGAPSPQEMADGMGKRMVLAFSQYKISVTDAEEFKTLVDKYGFPVFLKAVFPKAAGSAAAPSSPGNDKGSK